MSYHKMNLKENILAETLNMVEEIGYPNVSTRKIADELGISSAAIYRHFVSLDDLFHQLLKRISEIFARSLQEAASEETNAKNQLFKMAVVFVDFSIKKPHFFDALFLSPYSQEPNPQSQKEFLTISVFQEMVEKLIAENDLQVSSETLFLQLWSFILGYAMIVRGYQYPLDEEMIRKTIQQLI